MAIYRKGSDPVALRASAERITAHARECDAVKTEAGRAVHALRGHWGGGDLEHLMNRWPPVEAQLAQFGSDLGRLYAAGRAGCATPPRAVAGFPGEPAHRHTGKHQPRHLREASQSGARALSSRVAPSCTRRLCMAGPLE
jgi:hypothetical protein